jgi:hypothetical protein
VDGFAHHVVVVMYHFPSACFDDVSLIALNVNVGLIAGLPIIFMQLSRQEQPAKSIDVIGGGSVNTSNTFSYRVILIVTPVDVASLPRRQ